jgi:hypothetical protein
MDCCWKAPAPQASPSDGARRYGQRNLRMLAVTLARRSAQDLPVLDRVGGLLGTRRKMHLQSRTAALARFGLPSSQEVPKPL